jgi:Peptidase MA superfamily
MNRRIGVLVLAIGLLAPPAIAPVVAQEADQKAAPSAPTTMSISRDEAVADFPAGITFTLDAASHDPVADVELLYRSPGVDTYSVELPKFQSGATELAIEEPVDLRAGDLPPGVDVQYHWRITETDGDIVETPEQTILWADDRFDWKPLSGTHVTVYAYDGDDSFQQAILDSAERTIGKLGESYHAQPDQPIRIWAYANRDDFYGALAPNSEPWIAGAAYPTLHLIQAVLPPGDLEEVARVVPHEISHQVLHQATDNPFNSPPQWFDEGLAVLSQETGRDRFYTHALELALDGQVPPLRTLNGSFEYAREGAMADYSFSLSAVIYIIDTFGNEGMSKLVSTLPEGITYEAAIQKGLGISFDELDRRWREDLIADAKRFSVSGSTRFGDSGPEDGGSDLGGILALASGTLVLGGVVILAVIAGTIVLVRNRRRFDSEPESEDGLSWRDWPHELELPGWQPSSPGRP